MHKFLRICNSSLDLTLFDDDLYKIAIWNSFHGFAKYFRIVEKVIYIWIH